MLGMPERRKHEKFGILDSVLHFRTDFESCVGPSGVAVIYFDLDDFKKLNTRFSETVVDVHVLPKLQTAIAALVDKHGYAYAEGGDEYVITLHNAELHIAQGFAAALLAMIRELRFPIAGEEVQVTASAGVLVAKAPADPDRCRQAANAAKQTAKDRGKDQFVLEDETLSSGEESSLGRSLPIDSDPAVVLLLGRLYRCVKWDESVKELVVTVAPDSKGESLLRGTPLRSSISLAYKMQLVTGRLEQVQFTTEGAKNLGILTIGKSDEQHRGSVGDAAWGGNPPLTANDIAVLRARRILTDQPEASKDQFRGFGGPESLIRGGYQDGLAIDRSPIPEFLASRDRNDQATWKELRLELVRQLIASRAVDNVEHLSLKISKGRLVRACLTGFRGRGYGGDFSGKIVVDEETDF